MKTKTILLSGLALAVVVGGYAWRDAIQAVFSPQEAKPAAQAAGSGGGGPSAGGQRRRRGPQVLPVLVGKVEARPTPRVLTMIGSAQAYATVAVKSRVDGQILQAHFKEGDTVRKGDLLFRIDPRPFEVALRLAQANLERDRAQLAKAQGDVKRYQSLVGKGFASQQKYEEARATFGALQGTIRAAGAAIEAARLQLQYTSIHSPIDGRTGSLLVNSGNLVKANDTQALVVITQLKPIYVTYSVPERYLPRIKQLMGTTSVAVEARIPGAAMPPVKGRLVFVDNAVDTLTGTIRLKAEFENAAGEFTAGQFVNVAMTLEERPDALVVASRAIQEGQRGSYVFVVKPDSSVELRPVKVDDVVGDLTVVATGLAAGERVVLDGQLQLRPGSKVSERRPDGGRIPGGARPGGKGPPKDGKRRGRRNEVGGGGGGGGKEGRDRGERRVRKAEGA